jgi:hypothetical protein
LPQAFVTPEEYHRLERDHPELQFPQLGDFAPMVKGWILSLTPEEAIGKQAAWIIRGKKPTLAVDRYGSR